MPATAATVRATAIDAAASLRAPRGGGAAFRAARRDSGDPVAEVISSF